MARTATLAAVAILSAVVLAITAPQQIYDSNHYALSEATSILAGDRPYRDFFEVGIPLDAYLAAGALWASGQRLIGEFIRQWGFIVAGVVISFHLALRNAKSVLPALAVVPLALLVLSVTPTYHFSKLFLFPLTILLGWRYIERPGRWRGAALAFTTAAAFLVRHDYGVYLGVASVAAFVIARAAVPGSRNRRSLFADAATCAAVVLAVLAPWLVAVQATEGLIGYTQARSRLFQEPSGFVYASLFRLNPFAQFRREPNRPPEPATVVFTWNADLDDAVKHRLERELGLRRLDGGDTGPQRYEVRNIHEARLIALREFVHDAEGIPWDELYEMNTWLPRRAGAAEWLQHMALILPLAILVSGAAGLWRERHRSEALASAWGKVFAGIVLAVVCSALLREHSYVVVVGPTMAALASWFLAEGRWMARGVALLLIGVSTVSGVGWTRGGPLFAAPADMIESTRDVFAVLTRTPPDHAYAPFQYVRECSGLDDRLLITGLTPLHVSYYTGRPMAGGQINWHRGWRSDSAGEGESLALLQRQSVPFAISTADPVLTDFRQYPRIHAHLVHRYDVLKGSNGLLLADRDRTPVRTWGPHGWPCFR